MNQRTTIGGTVYESVGSNTSNLLLRCNGTARIQWGNKLIDLIKNGKLAVDNNSTQVAIIQDESEIKHDGLYVINKDKSSKLFVCKNGERYDLTGSDLYISASTKQDFTDEQKKQAKENLGIYYNTLEDLKNSGIQNGIAYVLEDTSLYTIQNGSVEEFEAKLKTVTVEKENEEGEVIKSSYKIVLQVLDSTYIVLQDSIKCYKDIVVDNSATISSEGANGTYGYRLYMDSGKSVLEIDKINVRDASNTQLITQLSYYELTRKISEGSLETSKWYIIHDFVNPWSIASQSTSFRPILVQAMSETKLSPYGFLASDPEITLQYDVLDNLLFSDGINTYTSKGTIKWMRDKYGNEANFDFLDFSTQTDSDGNYITTPHLYDDSTYSLFPVGSYNNKLTVDNVFGETFDASGNPLGCIVNFTFDDSLGLTMQMHDNVIHCSGSGLVLGTKCTDFYNNTFGIINNVDPIQANIHNCTFMNVTDCVFGEGTLSNIICRTDLSNQTFSSKTDTLLYDSTKAKDIYLNGSTLNITSVGEQLFYRGMIVMHSGIQPIPEGWAVCDGNSYTFNGVSSVTPNLVGRFIKATDSSSNVKAVDINPNNSVTLTKQNLPSHSHPHQSHTHNISLTGSGTVNTCTNTTPTNAVIAVDGGTLGYSGDKVSVQSVGVNMSLSGTSQAATSTETTQSWENTPFSIEPNYYSLIFIMKL